MNIINLLIELIGEPFVPKTSITSDKTQSLVLKYQSLSRLYIYSASQLSCRFDSGDSFHEIIQKVIYQETCLSAFSTSPMISTSNLYLKQNHNVNLKKKKKNCHWDKFTLSHSTNGIRQHFRTKCVLARSCNFVRSTYQNFPTLNRDQKVWVNITPPLPFLPSLNGTWPFWKRGNDTFFTFFIL